MVWSGQFFPQVLSVISASVWSHGSRIWTVGFSDVTAHEEIPGTEKKRVTCQSFGSINRRFSNSWFEGSLCLLDLRFIAGNPRSSLLGFRHTVHPQTPNPAPEHCLNV